MDIQSRFTKIADRESPSINHPRKIIQESSPTLPRYRLRVESTYYDGFRHSRSTGPYHLYVGHRAVHISQLEKLCPKSPYFTRNRGKTLAHQQGRNQKNPIKKYPTPDCSERTRRTDDISREHPTQKKHNHTTKSIDNTYNIVPANDNNAHQNDDSVDLLVRFGKKLARSITSVLFFSSSKPDR